MYFEEPWHSKKEMERSLKWGKGIMHTQLRPFWVTTPDRPKEMARLRVKVYIKGQGQGQDQGLVRAAASGKTHTCRCQNGVRRHAAACGGMRGVLVLGPQLKWNWNYS